MEIANSGQTDESFEPGSFPLTGKSVKCFKEKQNLLPLTAIVLIHNENKATLCLTKSMYLARRNLRSAQEVKQENSGLLFIFILDKAVL